MVGAAGRVLQCPAVREAVSELGLADPAEAAPHGPRREAEEQEHGARLLLPSGAIGGVSRSESMPTSPNPTRSTTSSHSANCQPASNRRLARLVLEMLNEERQRLQINGTVLVKQ